MSTKQAQKYCRECGRRRLHVLAVPQSDTMLYLGFGVLSVLTCGLFLPIGIAWVIMQAASDGAQRYRCQTCGAAN